MRFVCSLLCFLFVLAASIAPAMALPHCAKMNKQAAVSQTDLPPHCQGMENETNSDTHPQTPAPTTQPDNTPVKDGCCCDGDAGKACKSNCKSLSPVATLQGNEAAPQFSLAYIHSATPALFSVITGITTPPPKSCA